MGTKSRLSTVESSSQHLLQKMNTPNFQAKTRKWVGWHIGCLAALFLLVAWQLTGRQQLNTVTKPQPLMSETKPEVRKKIVFGRDHPHFGAIDADGKRDYVPDVHAIRQQKLNSILQQQKKMELLALSSSKNGTTTITKSNTAKGTPNDKMMQLVTAVTGPTTTPNLHPVCGLPPGEGFEGPFGYKLLTDFVQVDGPDPVPDETEPGDEFKLPGNINPSKDVMSTWEGHVQRKQQQQQQENQKASNRRSNSKPRETDENASLPPPTPPRILCGVYSHEAKHHPVLADIVDTWGWRCDGYYAASTRTERSIGAVHLPHEGKEEYINMWQKTRSMMAFMYDNYLDDFDYFLLCGDDTFIILENLRNYLLLLERETGGRDTSPLYIGLPSYLWNIVYNLGGSGYLLNRNALRRFVEDGLPYYFADSVASEEDGLVGVIMGVLHIHMVDTSDAAQHQRFFNDEINDVGSDKYPFTNNILLYKHGHRTGKNTVSTQSIGFHKVKSMKRFYAILYNACPRGTVLGDARNSTVAPF